MTKYNYKKAGKIWDELINITYDMPDYLDTSGRQRERRIFLRGLTRNDDSIKKLYINYITDYISEYSTPDEAAKLEKLALEIVLFTNENNY